MDIDYDTLIDASDNEFEMSSEVDDTDELEEGMEDLEDEQKLK